MAKFQRATILLADEHNFDREQRHGSIGAMYSNWLLSLRPGIDCQCYAAHRGELPKSVDRACLYVITGSRFSAYDPEPWIEQLTAFIHKLTAERAPVLGICFGHQLMAHALGGKVEKAAVGWGAGVHQYQVHPQFTADMPAEAFTSLVQHQDQVTQQPPDSTCLAGSDFCPMGMLRYDKLAALSFQCHPEFSRALARTIITERYDAIGAETSDSALDSLETTISVPAFSDWALQQLEQHLD